jgi:hypothetical protein
MKTKTVTKPFNRTEEFNKDNKWGTWGEGVMIKYIQDTFKTKDKFVSYWYSSGDFTKSKTVMKSYDLRFGTYLNTDRINYVSHFDVEVKCDGYDTNTGNLVFEKSSNKKKSGVFATKSKYFIYFLPLFTTDNLYIIQPNKLIELLRKKNISSQDLQKYIDSVSSGGSAEFTDVDLSTDEGYNLYRDICQTFIETRGSNLLRITGDMLAKAAKMTYENYQKYIPPELALAQLTQEGGFSSNPSARPIRTKNPFNVGNVDSGANVQHGDVQSGINTYYNLIAKDYLVKGKTASDLVKSFVNKNGSRYATAAYEPVISKIAGEANRIATPIYASLSKKPSTDTSSLA